MHPTLLEIFGLKFHAYTALLALAFVTCTLLTVRDLQRRHPELDANPQGGLWGFLGALLGAKIYWILQYSEPRYLWRAIFIWEGGLVFYGGLIGGLAALFVYLRVHKLPIGIVLDAVAPYLALGEAITRIGCFLNGCCWGSQTHVPWAVCFPRYSYAYEQQLELHQIEPSATAALPVHPTQLYMTGGLLIVTGALLWFARSSRRTGNIALLYCVLYGIVRFTVECFRADCARSVFAMTVSQSMSLALALGAVVVLAVRGRASGEEMPPLSATPASTDEVQRTAE